MRKSIEEILRSGSTLEVLGTALLTWRGDKLIHHMFREWRGIYRYFGIKKNLWMLYSCEGCIYGAKYTAYASLVLKATELLSQ